MTAVAESEAVRTDPAALKEFVRLVWEDLGLPAEDAEIAADAMVRADLRGMHSHGVQYVPAYVRMLREGGIRPTANVRVVKETPGTAVIDADGAFAHVAMVKAARVAAEKARAIGTATVLVKHSNHFGAAGYYTLKLAEEGLASIVAGNTVPVVGAPGAAGPVLGTSERLTASRIPMGTDLSFSIWRSAWSRGRSSARCAPAEKRFRRVTSSVLTGSLAPTRKL